MLHLTGLQLPCPGKKDMLPTSSSCPATLTVTPSPLQQRDTGGAASSPPVVPPCPEQGSGASGCGAAVIDNTLASGKPVDFAPATPTRPHRLLPHAKTDLGPYPARCCCRITINGATPDADGRVSTSTCRRPGHYHAAPVTKDGGRRPSISMLRWTPASAATSWFPRDGDRQTAAPGPTTRP